MWRGKGEKASRECGILAGYGGKVRAHRSGGDIRGMANPIRSKTKQPRLKWSRFIPPQVGTGWVGCAEPGSNIGSREMAI